MCHCSRSADRYSFSWIWYREFSIALRLEKAIAGAINRSKIEAVHPEVNSDDLRSVDSMSVMSPTDQGP